MVVRFSGGIGFQPFGTPHLFSDPRELVSRVNKF